VCGRLVVSKSPGVFEMRFLVPKPIVFCVSRDVGRMITPKGEKKKELKIVVNIDSDFDVERFEKLLKEYLR
jgi:hypothetical protein